MKRIFSSYIIIFAIQLFSNTATGQADTLLNFCAENLSTEYISDGQQYISLLNGDEIAEFRATFYSGSVYRIAGCSGFANGNLIFSVYDTERNKIFSNQDHKNTPYWDFKFTSTMECIIEAQLDPSGPQSGMAILLIGFKGN